MQWCTKKKKGHTRTQEANNKMKKKITLFYILPLLLHSTFEYHYNILLFLSYLFAIFSLFLVFSFLLRLISCRGYMDSAQINTIRKARVIPGETHAFCSTIQYYSIRIGNANIFIKVSAIKKRSEKYMFVFGINFDNNRYRIHKRCVCSV